MLPAAFRGSVNRVTMKLTIKLIFLFLLFSKQGFSQDTLCVHATDGNAKANGIKMSVSFPCNWTEIESRPNNQVLKFTKKDPGSKILLSVSLEIMDLPKAIPPAEAKSFYLQAGKRSIGQRDHRPHRKAHQQKSSRRGNGNL